MTPLPSLMVFLLGVVVGAVGLIVVAALSDKKNACPKCGVVTRNNALGDARSNLRLCWRWAAKWRVPGEFSPWFDNDYCYKGSCPDGPHMHASCQSCGWVGPATETGWREGTKGP